MARRARSRRRKLTMLRPTAVAILSTTAALLSGCGAVVVPEPRYYRIQVPETDSGAVPPAPAVEGAARPSAGVLRLGALSLAASVPGDVIVFSADGAELVPTPGYRWVGPLDGMLTDALARAAVRSGHFEQVRSARGGGPADWNLDGRVEEFFLCARGAEWFASVRVELHCTRGSDRALVFQKPFAAVVPCAAPTVEAGVAALGEALGEILAAGLRRFDDGAGRTPTPAGVVDSDSKR